MTNSLQADRCGVLLPDGRWLAFAEYGDPLGRPVIVFHGLPGSRLQRHPDASIARARCARVIHFDRPGFGRSDPKPGRTLADWSGDVAAAVDALGLDRFAVAGVSGGGPYALACAARLGHRVARVAVASGVGPPGSMRSGAATAPVRAAFALAQFVPWLLSAPAAVVGQLVKSHPERYIDLVAARMAPVDKEILARPAVRAMFCRDLREAFRQGPRAFAEDLSLLARPWHLPFGAIRTDIVFWHGDDDRMIPVSAARHLTQAIAGARLNVCGQEGHFLVLDRWGEILGWLVA
jgi:pimeloyl-ACP methyl ester carboxylesterase